MEEFVDDEKIVFGFTNKVFEFFRKTEFISGYAI